MIDGDKHSSLLRYEIIMAVTVLQCRDRIHNTSFPSLLTNGPKKLECYKTLPLKGLPGRNTLAYLGPFVSYEKHSFVNTVLGPYSQHFFFFLNYELDQ